MPASLTLELAVAEPGRSQIPSPPKGLQTEEWRQADGAITAVGYTAAGWRWMHLPGAATFRFEDGSSEVTAFAEPSCSREALRDTFERCVLPMALQARGLEALHASAVCTPRGVAAFCAVADTGKSTLAWGLALRGYALAADDAVIFRSGQECVSALPVPFSVRLSSAAAGFFGESPPAPGECLAGARALAAVCLLERVPPSAGCSPVEVARLYASRALTGTLTHAYCFDLRDTDRKRRMIHNYLDLISQVPVFRVRFQAGFDHLPALLDAVERTILA